MKLFKQIWEWLIKNFFNLFSLFGFILTIYFGVFYVPKWIKEYQIEKLKNAQNEIIQSVKELVFSDSTFTIGPIQTLVYAKELILKEKIPLSLSDIFSMAEESFMEDKFLPLSKRQELCEEIELIKSQLPNKNISDPQVHIQETTSVNWIEWLSIMGSLVAVLLGLLSAFLKYQTNKEKEEEIKNEKQDISMNQDHRHYAYEFETQILEVLKSRGDLLIRTNMGDSGIDFEFKYKDKLYFVEAKFLTRAKIGLNTFYQLKNFLQDKKGEAWLIYNTDLTSLVTKEIDKFNEENKNIQLKPIHVTGPKEFAERLDQLLN